ncbi:MAG: ABC transporter substrate-binding protein [Alphaproteobacteria bacterium]|nr:MAG: ABC transporter substrate-binding protein [Alphaproteobacteria bacterium]
MAGNEGPLAGGLRKSVVGVLAGAALIASLTVSSAQTQQAPGVSANRILFGQAAVLEGPAAPLGTGMRDGILAAFAEANRAGGVRGRQIELLARNDGYEPTQAIRTVRQLIEQDRVFALIGAVGTPTGTAIAPITRDAGVPLIGLFTGAEALRAPDLRNLVHVRASYFQETEMMVERLTRDLGVTRIGIYYQDDGFGRAGLTGIQQALARRQMALVGEATFERNTTAVKLPLLLLREARPQAIVIISAPAPSAAIIRAAREIALDATIFNISFVGSDALAAAAGPAGVDTFITQVVPLPTDTSIPLVARYQAALAAAVPNAQPGFVSLEGYITGRVALAALERITGEPTRQALLAAVAELGRLDLGGLVLTFGQNRVAGSDTVYLTSIAPNARFRAIETLKD